MKNLIIFIFIILLPFLLLAGVIFWKQPQWKEKEARERKELLSDTAKANAAHRTYERIHRQQLMEDPYYLELYEENEILKQKLDFIRATADDMQEHIDYFENKGFNVSDMQDIIDNIISESEY